MSFCILSFYFPQTKIYSVVYQCFQVLLPKSITTTSKYYKSLSLSLQNSPIIAMAELKREWQR